MGKTPQNRVYASMGREAGGDWTEGISGRDQGQCGGVRVCGGSVGPVAAEDIAAAGGEAVAGDPGGMMEEGFRAHMPMSFPISVIIPTFNRAHLLGEAIESCLNQRIEDLEII